MPQSYIKKILSARVYDVAIETPLDHAEFLSRRLHNRVLLKREDLQAVFSFKLRGAYNKLVHLSSAELNKGVIAASAGNHGQGLALAAAKLKAKATIVMPKTTPEIKVDVVRNFGANVVLHGDSYDEASQYAQQMRAESGMVYVHPYDDPLVIAGQGTIAMEVLHQYPGQIDAVFVPVGGGGLLAGMATYIKFVRPDIRVIGVEPEDAACLLAAREAGKRVILDQVGIFADGVAVKQIGKETFRIIRDTVDEVITVDSDEICAAIKDIFADTRSIAEPAGALALAGLKKYVASSACTDKTLVAIESGANINFDRLRHISERSEIGEKREAILSVEIPEKPGSFRTFCETLGSHDITEFNYRYDDAETAKVFVGVQISYNKNNLDQLMSDLSQQGYHVEDLTDNEMAKLHVRYMVGGRIPAGTDELVYRFEIPERPGALQDFLSQLGSHWNISLFHYRKHGLAYGHILVGLQLPNSERDQVASFLKGFKYAYRDETDNSAYRLFLRNTKN